MFRKKAAALTMFVSVSPESSVREKLLRTIPPTTEIPLLLMQPLPDILFAESTEFLLMCWMFPEQYPSTKGWRPRISAATLRRSAHMPMRSRAG